MQVSLHIQLVVPPTPPNSQPPGATLLAKLLKRHCIYTSISFEYLFSLLLTNPSQTAFEIGKNHSTAGWVWGKIFSPLNDNVWPTLLLCFSYKSWIIIQRFKKFPYVRRLSKESDFLFIYFKRHVSLGFFDRPPGDWTNESTRPKKVFTRLSRVVEWNLKGWTPKLWILKY